MKKYGIPSLQKDFPHDTACIEYIFDALHARDCNCGGEYRLMNDRGRVIRIFQCSKCRTKISPTKDTIFDHSPTPLTLWFKAMLAFSNAKSGVSAKYMERELEVTYKCAYRILSQIRKALKQSDVPLRGIVETDAGFFGGRYKSGTYNKYQAQAAEAKAKVLIAVERNGDIRAKVRPNVSGDELESFVRSHVEAKSILMSDGAKALNRLDGDYEHHRVNHSKKEYVRGVVYTTTVDSWIAHIKRSIRGTFKSVSREKLQEYLDAFVFLRNNRHNDKRRFEVLLGTIVRYAR